MEKREGLIENLVSFGYLKTPSVIDAMRQVCREFFLPEGVEQYSYEDTPLSIGHGQTISAPHMVAIMCENAELEEGQTVLEVGAGSGYHSCVISKITKTKVYAVERVGELAESAKTNLRKAGCEDVFVVVGDGSLGYTDKSPYDRIIVTAGAPEVPEPLVDQLKAGGKLLIPVGSRLSQELLKITKGEKGVETENLGGCVFVPLIGRYGWHS